MVILICGKKDAGKTTYARRLAAEYGTTGQAAMVLDGDEVRDETNNRDFTDYGRRSHLIKMAELAAKLESQDIVAIVACVAPRKEWRDMMRSMWVTSRLVYVPGGELWHGTKYESPEPGEFNVYHR